MTATPATTERPRPPLRSAAAKVPEITVFFWVVKVLATTLGETVADLLSDSAGLGLRLTTVLVGAVLAAALVLQVRAARYAPWRYWGVVLLVSVAGTLVTDLLVDVVGIPLPVTTAGSAVLLLVVFGLWRRREGTLSIHAVNTRSREAWYWAAVLVTFALGTAAGDLVSEQLGAGYLLTGVLCATLVAASWAAWRLGAGPVLTFWVAYVLTRPLGASLGDGFAQPHADGGLGLGTLGTSAAFLVVAVAVVTHLTVTRRDAPQGVR